MSFAFFCPGTPIGQGSKKVVPTHGGPRAIEDNDAKLRPWRHALVVSALEAMNGSTMRFTGAVRAEMIFLFRRPKGHYGTGRNAAVVKETAPKYRASKPDADKLARAVLDALTVAGVLMDDRQVVSLGIIKRYAEPHEPEGVRILVDEVEA